MHVPDRMRSAVVTLLLWAAAAPIQAADSGGTPLTVQQIVERNVAARGGLDAWRKLDTMAWAGHIESERSATYNMPFVLEQKRPNLSRFEILAVSQRSLRIFNGKYGWKMRPAQDGAPDVQPFTTDEVTYAQNEPGFDGPLIDYAAKGNSVALEGEDELDGHKTYRLLVTLASGEQQHYWIDASTFLEARLDRPAATQSGQTATASIYYREYKDINGLHVPSIIEFGGAAATGSKPDRMVIERVALNPKLDARAFSRPGIPSRRVEVTIDPPAPGAAAARQP